MKERMGVVPFQRRAPSASNDEDLPPGLYYEEARRRYRVRLYKDGTVFYRAYFYTLCEALRAREAAIEEREKDTVPPQPIRPLPQQLLDAITPG